MRLSSPAAFVALGLLASAGVSVALAQTTPIIWGGGGSAWFTPAHWTGGVVPSTTDDIAVFTTGTPTSITVSGTDPDLDLAGIQFNSGASAYTLTFDRQVILWQTGVVNNSSSNQTFTVNQPLTFLGSGVSGSGSGTTTFNIIGANFGSVSFQGSASAGNAIFTLDSPQTQLAFVASASAGSASISGSGGVHFSDNASAGSAAISLEAGAFLGFSGAASASTAVITAGPSAAVTIVFDGNGNAANASISLAEPNSVLDLAERTTSQLSIGTLNNAGTTYLGGHELTVGASGNNMEISGTIRDEGFNVSGPSYQGGALRKVGAGRLTLSGDNTYTGGTFLSAGALTLGASERLFNAGGLTLSGGTFELAGFSETLGGLTLSGNATIDFGSAGGANNLVFAPSNGFTWSGSLTILNFSAVSGDTLRFGTTSSGLTGTQLGLINFNGAPAQIDGSGFVTAVPEPATYAAFAGAAMLGFAALRRRVRRTLGPAA